MSEALAVLFVILLSGAVMGGLYVVTAAVASWFSRPGTQRPGDDEDLTIPFRRDPEAEWAAKYPTREHPLPPSVPMHYGREEER